MSLKNGVNNSKASHTSGRTTLTHSGTRVTQVLDSIQPVFQAAIIKNTNKKSPIFFKPEKIIDSPFEDMFVPANVGLREFNTGDFIPANTGLLPERDVYRSRPNNSRSNSTSYLVASII